LAAIPLIGPLLAVGVMGTQITSEAAAEGKYRAYDREDELAADRFALDLLGRAVGRIRGCQGTLGILERLQRERATRIFSAWLSTHRTLSDPLRAVSELCSGGRGRATPMSRRTQGTA